jgi:peptidase M28-like protein
MHLLLALLLCAGLDPQMQSVADHISADSMRGHLSFIASDLLEGRATPSRGLDLAAEYIAAQFRRAGLEPAGDEGYFQTATLLMREPDWDGFQMTVSVGGKTVQIDKSELYLVPDSELSLDSVPVVAVNERTRITREMVEGKVVIVTDQRRVRGLEEARPALVLVLMPELPSGPQVRDPENGRRLTRGAVVKPELASLTTNASDARLTLHMAKAQEHPVKVRNVAGLLRGSDAALRDTYVMLTAHYDHVGMQATGEDRIYNGANDDGSGTVSVIEIAGALAALEPRPKRSILFMTFFGEEGGQLGSHYYTRHPLEPLDKTIADLNLEHMGRTDATSGRQVGTASLTGYDFSDLPRIVGEVGKLVGVKVYKDSERSEAYFARSDNQPLAEAGIPAHTLCVAFDFPDYHKVSDHWEKIDYTNMAKVDRAVALSLLQLASDAPPPKWNDSIAGARRYAEAAKKLH